VVASIKDQKLWGYLFFNLNWLSLSFDSCRILLRLNCQSLSTKWGRFVTGVREGKAKTERKIEKKRAADSQPAALVCLPYLILTRMAYISKFT
jgi:hypothetical protein